MKTIIQRYILRELLPPFGISLAFFSFIFIITQMNLITGYLVSYQIGIGTIVLLLTYAMPYFLQFVIPMSVMLSTLLTFLRMSGDMEIVALKAGGVSIYRLLPPVLLFGLMGMILTASMTIYGSPMGHRASKQLIYDVAAANVDLGLKPRQFVDTFKDVVLYVHDIDSGSKTLKNIFIEDHRSAKISSTVLAPRGQLFFDPHQLTILLRLFDGTIHQVDLKERQANTVAFESYDIRLDMQRNLEALGQRAEHVKEMGLGRLYRAIDDAKGKKERFKALKEWHKKFSLPVACLVMAVLGMPLGIRARSSKRAYGIGLGLGFFLLYYILLSVGWMLAESGIYPPIVGMWAPNGVCAAIGVILLARAVHEKPMVVPPLLLWLKKWHRHHSKAWVKDSQ
jgi:lipopolysaccharide export system permease protein